MDDDCDNDSRNSSNAEENSYALILTASEEDLNLEDCYNFTTNDSPQSLTNPIDNPRLALKNWNIVTEENKKSSMDDDCANDSRNSNNAEEILMH